MGVYLKDLNINKGKDKKKSKHKYNAKSVDNQFGHFDSNAEFLRYLNLLDQQRMGLIKDIKKHVRFEIVPSIKVMVEKKMKTKTKLVERVDESARHYTCDFMYTRVSDGVTVIEDVKSEMTAKIRDYGLRKHLMKWLIARMNEAGGKYEFNEVVYK